MARLTAGAVVLLNPYVVVFANRTSVTLLAYALLPWMLLAVHRGLRHPRGWWWPAALALLAGAAGGGVNVAVIAWLALAPLALLVYEPAIGAVTWRDARGFAWRAAACLAVASLWWVAPVVVHVLYGRDFLPFTEQPGVIWGTTSGSEALRLMGYWTSYIGVGYGGDYRAFTSDAGVMLFHPAVVVASLLMPALVAARAAGGPALDVCAVLPDAAARRRADRDGRLPGGLAPAEGGAVRLLPCAGRPVPAHDLQGGAADRRGVRAAGGRRGTVGVGPARARAEAAARANRGRGVHRCACSRSPRTPWSAARRSTPS